MNFRRTHDKKAACWTSVIHSHTEKAWSYNTGLLPIYMYFRYSLNYTLLFETDWLKQAKRVQLWQQKDLAFAFAILVATVPRGIRNASLKNSIHPT